MREFEVISLSLGGRGNRLYRFGDIVTENNLSFGNIDKLIASGHIKEINPRPIINDIPVRRKVTGKIKIAIVSMIWKRHDVFEIFAKSIQKLIRETPFEIVCIIAGSEGRVSRDLCDKYGFDYTEVPNEPLGEKASLPVRLAKGYDPDYVFCLGSDDIFTPKALMAYEPFMRKGIDYIGVSDFYFLHHKNKQALYWGGYTEPWRKGHTCGAGRMISNRLLNLWDWRPWDIKYNNILDTSIQVKLSQHPHTTAVFSLKEAGVMAFDIKSDVNMTPFKRWDNTEEIHPKQLLKICADLSSKKK